MLGADLFPCLQDDYLVCGVDLRPAEYLNADRFFSCDLTLETPTFNLLKKINPRIIIHAAAYTNVDGCESAEDDCRKVNVQSTKNLAAYCRQANVPLVFLSTDYVFDGQKNEPYAETDRPAPLNAYGRSKRDAEQVIIEVLEKYLIVRTSWLFGRNGKNFVRTIINKARETGELEVVDDQVGSPTYTRDLSAALKNLIRIVFDEDGRQYGTYHVSNSGTCSWCGFAREIVRQKNIAARIIAVDSNKVKRPAKRPRYSVMNTDKYRDLCSRTLRPWPEALQAYLAEEG